MRPKVNTWINWSAKELDDLVNQKNSCVFKETIKKHIPMYSVHLSDVRKSFKDILNSSINTFDSSFDGLLISYQNPTILCPLTQMFYDIQFVHVDLQADFYIFRPTVDSILTGIVNKKETNYIGVLMHKTFNVSITKRSDDEYWLGHNVFVGDKATFRVTQVDLKAKVPFIRGELLSSETTENDEQMDFAEEEINEEGGNERDSGYQESENETKPSKSKIINGFLAGEGSDEEHTRKAKKKKIKSPDKTLQVKNEHLSAASPIKVAKKRKHDHDNDGVSPKKETQTKVKRLKVDDQVKEEEEQRNMQEELLASPSHSVTGSDKPRIIYDQVLPSRNSIKLENNVEKKTKKKKASHDISESDEDQSSQSSKIISQEKEEKDDEDDDDDDMPRDHSQYFGHKESIPSSDDEPETPVKESVDKSPQKKRENKDEKKSKKNKAEIGTRSQEDLFQVQSQSRETYSQEEKNDSDGDDDDDDDMPHDHSQYFAPKESVPASDNEAEVPEMKESIDKSPKKKLKDDCKKKSQRKMAEGAIKNMENQSQSSKVGSQEGDEDDFPRDHSQFVREKLLTPNDDFEPKIPEAKVKKPVVKRPRKKVEKESQEKVESENVVEKKVQKRTTKIKEPVVLTLEDIDKLEKLREYYAESIDQAVIKICSENYKEEELEKHTDYEFLEDNFEELPNFDTAKKDKISKSKEIKKPKPLGNSTIIESQLDSPGFSRVQEPSVSPVIPELKIKKSKTKDVVQSHELQSSEETDSVAKKVKKAKKPKENTSEVYTGVNILSSDQAMPSSVRVNEEQKIKKSKTVETVQNTEPTAINGSLASPAKNSRSQELENNNEEPKKLKKSKKIVEEEKSSEKVEKNCMMLAIDKVLTSASKNSMILGGFSDSDDDLPDQPIVLSSVKVEKNNELVNGEIKKSNKSKKSKDKDLGSSNQTFEESNLVNDSVMIDTSTIKEEKEKKKKKVPEINSVIESESILLNQTGQEINSVNESVVINTSRIKEEKKKKKKKKTCESNSVIESESTLLNNTEVDTNIVKQESKKKKKKKLLEGIANPLSNSTINDSQLDSFTELDDSTFNSSELQMSVIKIKEEHKGKKSKVADPSGSSTINESELDSVVEDSSRLQGLGNSGEVRTKKSKSKEFIEPQVPQKESEGKKSKSKKSNFDVNLKIKEEPASDAEGSNKKSKSKHKDTDKSNVSKKITIKQEVIIKQEDKKSGKRKNRDDTINLSDVKFEAGSDAEGPAAKKKIHKLVFTE
ncbi:probable serine/threonine-protein kinase kinX isoform X4 [Cotesia glomerata]|uniref:probable serine/threonine-protein kinase kinX isoform X4 n=1 Tax=Cotesia glomerata TaxID=32391 RepID=UPI001D02EE54|nr:probable serine/threonine-protein kinase kinX isoform X4 [Cotesia glomerata]